MRFLLILSFSFITGFTCAHISDSAISTISQNERWMDELEKLPMREQVSGITKRLLLDTSVYARNSFPAEVRYSKNNGARPLYVINGFTIPLCNIQDVKDVVKLTTLISGGEIKQVLILRGGKATALYGSCATAGVIKMEMKDGKKSNLEELNLGDDCHALYICGMARAYMDAQAHITTPEQNQKWLDELSALPVKKQVDKINNRLLLDIKPTDQKSTPQSTAYNNLYPLFVVNGVPVDIASGNSKQVTEFTTMLSQAEKINITIVEKTLDGCFTPKNGVILIQILDKEVKKKSRK